MNDRVAFDAGSLALACGDEHRRSVRDVVLSHTHLDHIAGLPLFIDDLFTSLTSPVRVHGTREMINALRDHIFNGLIYPPFHTLSNERGSVLEFVEYSFDEEFTAAGIGITPIAVNHSGPSAGFLASCEGKIIGITGDTAGTDDVWDKFSKAGADAVLVECAFPDELAGLAADARHLTPKTLAGELEKLACADTHVYIVNIKPMFRDKVLDQLAGLNLPKVSVLEAGRIYEV